MAGQLRSCPYCGGPTPFGSIPNCDICGLPVFSDTQKYVWKYRSYDSEDVVKLYYHETCIRRLAPEEWRFLRRLNPTFADSALLVVKVVLGIGAAILIGQLLVRLL